MKTTIGDTVRHVQCSHNGTHFLLVIIPRSGLGIVVANQVH